jgi:hypothetical protein
VNEGYVDVVLVEDSATLNIPRQCPATALLPAVFFLELVAIGAYRARWGNGPPAWIHQVGTRIQQIDRVVVSLPSWKRKQRPYCVTLFFSLAKMTDNDVIEKPQ